MKGRLRGEYNKGVKTLKINSSDRRMVILVISQKCRVCALDHLDRQSLALALSKINVGHIGRESKLDR